MKLRVGQVYTSPLSNNTLHVVSKDGENWLLEVRTPLGALAMPKFTHHFDTVWKDSAWVLSKPYLIRKYYNLQSQQ